MAFIKTFYSALVASPTRRSSLQSPCRRTLNGNLFSFIKVQVAAIISNECNYTVLFPVTNRPTPLYHPLQPNCTCWPGNPLRYMFNVSVKWWFMGQKFLNKKWRKSSGTKTEGKQWKLIYDLMCLEVMWGWLHASLKLIFTRTYLNQSQTIHFTRVAYPWKLTRDTNLTHKLLFLVLRITPLMASYFGSGWSNASYQKGRMEQQICKVLKRLNLIAGEVEEEVLCRWVSLSYTNLM